MNIPLVRRLTPYFKASVVNPIMALACVLSCAQDVRADTSSANGNLLRNGSFENGDVFNGTNMRRGSEIVRINQSRSQKTCIQLPAAGWWEYGKNTEGILLDKKNSRSGTTSLLLNPPPGQTASVFSAPEVSVPAADVTLSAWVRTTGAKGTLVLEFVAQTKNNNQAPASLGRKELALPSAAQEWTQVRITTTAPENAAVVAWVKAESGQVQVDDLQLEVGAAPTAFDVRADEVLSLSFADTPEDRLPFWKEKEDSSRTLRVRNDSRSAIDGSLEIWTGPWSKPDTERVSVIENFKLSPGATRTIRVKLGHLKPDAYVLFPLLKKNGIIVIDGRAFIDTTVRIGGAASNSMLLSQTAVRFAITPDTAPAKIFGVGNGMIEFGWTGKSGNWSSGWPLDLYATAKNESFVCGRGRRSNDDQAYLFAATGVPFHRMDGTRATSGAPKGASFEVPGGKGGIDIWNPDGMAFFKKVAEKVGQENESTPHIASYQMANEMPFPFHDGLCPTPAADAHFRAWCKQRHGSLDALNRNWGTAYASWDEVEQPVSARYAESVVKRKELTGAAAIDWTATTGKITPELEARIKSTPGRGMDWMRWRTHSSLWMYDTFRDTARRHDSKTLYGTNLCWPDFWPQLSMPLFRAMDAAMLDVQYTSGQGPSLGTPMEMLEIMEMIESNTPGKPILGIEVYVQPTFDPEFAPLQNWGLLAHGMTTILTFGWGPYSDHGIPKGTKSWEKPDAVPMWLLIDNDGTKLPAYYTNRRSQEEIARFHRQFDGLSLKRVGTDIALYVSNDTAEYISYETANKPWGSPWIQTRSTLAYLLRMNGITADFVDDETMPDRVGRFRTMILPASYVLSQASAKKIARFARDGGTVVLAGVSGMVDPWLRPYANLGGPAWEELDWKAPDFKLAETRPNYTGGVIAGDGPMMFKGTGIDPMPQAADLRDGAGTVVGWRRSWGKGRIIAYASLPYAYNSNPHPDQNLAGWIKRLIETAELSSTGRWIDSGTTEKSTGSLGAGAPVVEVVVRVKKGNEAKEKFVFVLNQGGAGSGTVEIPTPDGIWRMTDALTGVPVDTAAFAQGTCSLKLDIKPWGYRVFRLMAR